jgi:hypothetical protein
MKKVIIILLSFAMVILLFSCKPGIIYEDKISGYLDSTEILYENICIRAGIESWDFYSGSLQNRENQYRAEFSLLLNDTTLQQNITTWIRDTSLLKNDTLKRRLDVWNNILTWSKVDLSPGVIKLQNQLEIQLANSPLEDSAKEEIVEGIKKLISMRNKKAQLMGYSNYAYFMLQNTGIDTIWFEHLVQMIDSASTSGYDQLLTQIKRNNNTDTIVWSDIKPFVIQANELNNLPDITGSNKKDLINNTLKKIGLDLSKKPIHVSILDLPPGLGGLGIGIDIPNDFRTVMRSDLEFRYMLHEIGHGLHWTHVDMKYPILKGYDYCANPTLLNGEAMAEIIGNFSRNHNWMLQNGYSQNQLDSITDLNRTIAPVWLRLKLIKSLFEIELYKNPHMKASEIKCNLYNKYLNIDFDFSRFNNLISLTYVSYPVYEQNYLIADIISWHIHEYLAENFGSDYINNIETGSFLKDKLWKDGEYSTWRDKLITATGNDINIRGYLTSKCP